MTYTAKTWIEGNSPKLTAANIQIMDNGIESAFTGAGGLPGDFSKLVMMTHPDADEEDEKAYIRSLDWVVMNDGEAIASWADMSCDITASGANGLDTGSVAANTWYALHAIAKTSDGTKALIFTLADAYTKDQEHATNDGQLGIGDNAAREKIEQGFQVSNAGECSWVDLYLDATGAPTDYLTVTIEGDDGGGDPDGTPLATGIVLGQDRIYTSLNWVRVLFLDPPTLSTGTTYHIVLDRSGAVDAAKYISLGNDSGAGYGSGTLKTWNGAAWADSGTDGNFRVYIQTTTESITFPSGYDQSCKLGYFLTDGSSDLIRMSQIDRRARLHRDLSGAGTSVTTATPTLVLDSYLPPTHCMARIRAVGSATHNELPGAAGVPDGYQIGINSAEEGGGMRVMLVTSSNTIPTEEVCWIFTQAQSWYTNNTEVNAGTAATVWAVEYEWLR